MGEDVLVVIGAGGMGQAIARRLGSGRQVLLADFDADALNTAADLLGGAGQQVTTRSVDVSDGASVASLADAAADLGRVTHVAHTAGLSPVQASTEAILRVDLLGVALVLDEFARVVAPGGAGVAVASMAAHMPSGHMPSGHMPSGHVSGALPAEREKALASTPTRELLQLPFLEPGAVGDPGSAYALAKRANVLRVQASAAAWGERGARINSISPGVISTSMGQQELAGEAGEQMRAMVDMSATKRLGAPEDIAAAAAFLLDPGSGFITGTDLLVDGGVVPAVRALMAD